MHPVSPLLEGWKVVTAVVAVLTVRNADNLVEAYRYATAHGIDLAHGVVRWVAAGALAAVAAVIAFLLLRWWVKTYAVDRDGVYLRSGILVRQLRVARLPRIQSVDVVHPLLGRVLGLGQLTVEVAGGSDSRVVIGYLSTDRLEELRDRILDLAAGAADAAGAAEADAADADGAAGLDADVDHAGPAGPADSAGPARRPAPLGFEDAVGASPLRSAGGREEHPLYTVGPAILIGSILRSVTTLWAVLIVIVILAAAIAAIVARGVSAMGAGFLLSAVAGPAAIVGAVWGRFNRSWGFRAAATPTGIRMRFGLTSEISSTLPPGRVHGVSIEQGPLWRRRDWWRVRVAVAGRSGKSSSDASSGSGDGRAGSTGSVLLPVGERDTALRALWLVVPDLGVPDPGDFLAAALSGTGDDGAGRPDAPVGAPERGLIRISPRGRIFSPLAWRREAIALTGTCVVLRTGRWWRRTGVVPYERIQSLRVRQGPFARSRGLASIHLDMVDHSVPTSLSNLGIADAAAIQRVVSERALRRRRAERLDRWLARAADKSPGGPADPGGPPGAA
ncbi:MAG: hypothetical protein DI576_04005 [Actinomyces sp.]|nr:MAG: hypothetical protein DI576_04005 [Actinomyces sp.]